MSDLSVPSIPGFDLAPLDFYVLSHAEASKVLSALPAGAVLSPDYPVLCIGRYAFRTGFSVLAEGYSRRVLDNGGPNGVRLPSVAVFNLCEDVPFLVSGDAERVLSLGLSGVDLPARGV